MGTCVFRQGRSDLREEMGKKVREGTKINFEKRSEGLTEQ